MEVDLHHHRFVAYYVYQLQRILRYNEYIGTSGFDQTTIIEFNFCKSKYIMLQL